jgi:hypothetical protein
MLNRIVAGDESWAHHYQLEPKRASLPWKHPSSPSSKRFVVTPSAGKFMLTVLWDCQGVVLTHFQKRGDYVNSASCCEAIRRKLLGQLARRVGTASSWQCQTSYSPSNPGEKARTPVGSSYNPDLASSDFHLFGSLKNPLWWQTLRWWRKDWNETAEVAKTTVKRLLCFGFRRTGKAMEQAYRCWWRNCREIYVFFPGSNITPFALYIHLWPINWLSLVN